VEDNGQIAPIGVAPNTGDLIVTVEVDVPKQLDDGQRAAIEALAAATPSSPRAALIAAASARGG